MIERDEQVKLQCQVVAYLARAIADVFEDHSKFIHPELVELRGKLSAGLMDILGDILNGMDACTEDDEWTAPIFDEAHRLWPQKEAAE